MYMTDISLSYTNNSAANISTQIPAHQELAHHQVQTIAVPAVDIATLGKNAVRNTASILSKRAAPTVKTSVI
jgi:hypothetical protein